MDHQTGDLLTQSRGLCLRYSAWQVVQVYRIDDRLKTEVRQDMLCLCRYNQFIKAQNYRIIAPLRSSRQPKNSFSTARPIQNTIWY